MVAVPLEEGSDPLELVGVGSNSSPGDAAGNRTEELAGHGN